MVVDGAEVTLSAAAADAKAAAETVAASNAAASSDAKQFEQLAAFERGAIHCCFIAGVALSSPAAGAAPAGQGVIVAGD